MDFEEFSEELVKYIKSGESFTIMGDAIQELPDIEQIYKNYAKETNKTVESLTTLDKQKALLNHILSQPL